MILKEPICKKKLEVEHIATPKCTAKRSTCAIPTGIGSDDIHKREQVIDDFYRNWMKKNPTKKVYNNSLKEYINVRFLSINETKHHAAKTYLSTLAVLQLDAILSHARKYGKQIKTKPGVKNQEGFSHMIEMRYKLHGIGTVKLMVGVKKTTGAKLQYCVTVLQ